MKIKRYFLSGFMLAVGIIFVAFFMLKRTGPLQIDNNSGKEPVSTAKTVDTFPEILLAEKTLNGGKIKEAKEMLLKILKTAPYDSFALRVMGMACEKENNFELAEHYFTMAAAKADDLNRSMAYFELGSMYFHRGDNKKSLQYLESALKINPRDSKILSLYNEVKARGAR